MNLEENELGKHSFTTRQRKKYTSQQTKIFGPDKHWQQIQRYGNDIFWN